MLRLELGTGASDGGGMLAIALACLAWALDKHLPDLHHRHRH